MRKILIVVIPVLLLVIVLVIAGAAISQDVPQQTVKSLPVHMTIIANMEVGVYFDPQEDSDSTAWYIGDIKRGTILEQSVWIKALGETIDVMIVVDGPEWVTITPDRMTLSPGDAMTECMIRIAPPFAADLGEITTTIEFRADVP